jgi:hypothetical protein
MKARTRQTRTTQARTTQSRGKARAAATETEGRGLELLDRLIGDALVGAMILLGFALCLGAARAETWAERANDLVIHESVVTAPIPAS